LLKTQRGGILVTGDQLLVDNPPADWSVLTPRHFFELLLHL